MSTVHSNPRPISPPLQCHLLISGPLSLATLNSGCSYQNRKPTSNISALSGHPRASRTSQPWTPPPITLGLGGWVHDVRWQVGWPQGGSPADLGARASGKPLCFLVLDRVSPALFTWGRWLLRESEPDLEAALSLLLPRKAWSQARFKGSGVDATF